MSLRQVSVSCLGQSVHSRGLRRRWRPTAFAYSSRASGNSPILRIQFSKSTLTRSRSHCHATFVSSADAWVGDGVGDVGEEVDGDVGEADGEDAALDQGVVAVGDGGEREAANAGPGKDRLRDDGAGEQAAKLQADDGEDRNESVGEGVTVDDGALGKTLGAGGADVVLIELFEHGGADHAGQDACKAAAQRDGGEDEVEEELPAEDGGGARTGDGRPT